VRTSIWVFNPVYQLPFGKGKQFLGNASRGVDYLVGGWGVSNSTNWSSGLPWTPSFNLCGPEQDVGVCRPNKGPGSLHLGVGPLLHPANSNPVRQYFTPVPAITSSGTGPFTDPGVGNLGNIGYNSFRGPRGFYSDMSITKDIPIGERVKGQFRMDAFNIFNHPVFNFSGNSGANSCIDCQGGTNGQITDIEFGSTMRALQFAVRVNF